MPEQPTATPAAQEKSTHARIITAALRVFANRGFEAATLKEITQLSQTNVAAIHYHFGSKEALVQAVLASVANPINQRRMQLLQLAPKGAQCTTAHVVHALVAPPIQLSFDTTGDAKLLTRLLLQARALPAEFTSTSIFANYDETAQHFVRALMEVTPGLSRADAYWRYAFTIGAMHYIVTESDTGHSRLQRISEGLCNTGDADTIIQQLIAFVVAGFQAATPGA